MQLVYDLAGFEMGEVAVTGTRAVASAALSIVIAFAESCFALITIVIVSPAEFVVVTMSILVLVSRPRWHRDY